MKNMNGWSTDFSNLPEEGRVIVTQVNVSWSVGMASVELIRLHPDKFKAWQPIPEPYAPPKPEQISSEEADKFRAAQVVEDASPAMRISGNTPMQKLIKEVEERTREIVAWEQEYGDNK